MSVLLSALFTVQVSSYACPRYTLSVADSSTTLIFVGPAVVDGPGAAVASSIQ